VILRDCPQRRPSRADRAVRAAARSLCASVIPVISRPTDLGGLDPISVGPSEVIYAFLAMAGEPSARDEELLDDQERARSARFVRTTDRRRFVLAHAGLRLFLARCLDIDPTAVRYEHGVHGKPRLAPDLPPLEFNLSHSGRLGLVAVARDLSVGVDIEQVREVPDIPSTPTRTSPQPSERYFDRCRRPSAESVFSLLDA
jgi:hypothetical protein